VGLPAGFGGGGLGRGGPGDHSGNGGIPEELSGSGSGQPGGFGGSFRLPRPGSGPADLPPGLRGLARPKAKSDEKDS